MAGLPIQLEVTGEARRVGTDQENVCGLLQDEPGRADRMPHRLDARHRAGLQRAPFHEGGVHPPDAVQLEVRTGPGVERPDDSRTRVVASTASTACPPRCNTV